MANPAAIKDVIRSYPNAKLTVAPTPICHLPRLSALLRRNVYAKREDLTGFALGGNKVRKLDFLIGDALSKKVDTLVTTAATSFSRNAASAGKVFGMEVHVVVYGTESEHNTLSQDHFHSVGAILHYVPKERLQERYRELVQELREKGRKVYELHPGGSDCIGALGYVNVFDEIVSYTESTGIHFHKIILPTGSTGTQAGLMLGQSISGYKTQIIGMAISQKEAVQRELVRKLAVETAEMLHIPF